MRLLAYCVSLAAVSGLCASAQVQTATIDFDTAAPALPVGQNIPLEQTAGAVKAVFSSPSGAAFSVQTDASSRLRLSKFTGKYLYDNDLNRSVLQIRFSRPLTAITFGFATGDYEIEVPSALQLTAYLDATGTPPVGSVTARARYGSDSLPTGTLSFDSGGRPFNLVEITMPYEQPRGATVFFLDDITVKLAAEARILSSVCAASYQSADRLAPGSIVSGFGVNLATATAEAASQPLPTILANTTVTVKDSAGAEREAPLFFVSPGQINYAIQDGTAMGPATVTVRSAGQVTATGALLIEPVAPGLFTANRDGKAVPAANAITVAPDLTQSLQEVARCGAAPGSCLPSPIDLGPAATQVILVLYGTGIRGRTSLAGVSVRIGGLDANVHYAGPQTEFFGLDQVNVLLPRALAGKGEVDVVLTVDGKQANTVRIHIK